MLDYSDALSRHQFLTNFCLSLRHRYFCAPVPKAAHTTLKLLLSQLEIAGLPVGLADLNVHNVLCSPFVHMYQLSPDLIDEVVTSPEFYRFAIVRDPFDRITSCYLDKIARPSPERKVFSQALAQSENDTIGFMEFLRVIESQPVAAMDMHWKPQAAILLWGKIDYQFIGRMESFSVDLDRIFMRITGKQAEHAVKMQVVKHHATGATDLAHRYVDDPKAKALIRKIYDVDFRAFSYDRR